MRSLPALAVVPMAAIALGCGGASREDLVAEAESVCGARKAALQPAERLLGSDTPADFARGNRLYFSVLADELDRLDALEAPDAEREVWAGIRRDWRRSIALYREFAALQEQDLRATGGERAAIGERLSVVSTEANRLDAQADIRAGRLGMRTCGAALEYGA